MAIAVVSDPIEQRGSGASAKIPRKAPEPVAGSPGITRRVLLNLLETFFRRPFIYLIPLVLMIGVGIYSGFSAEKEYRSVGTLTASSGTVLDDIARSGTNRTYGYESSAASASRSINQQLRTRAFLSAVIERAGLTTAVEEGLVTATEIRESVWASEEGDNILSVVAQTPRPEQSQRLAQATIDEYLYYVITNDNADRLIAIDTYETQLEAAQSALSDANQAYEQYMVAHPIADEDDRPFDERLEIQRLERTLEVATENAQEAETNLRDAQLEASVAQTIIERQLRMVDPPILPEAPEPRLMAAVMTLMLFTVLGIILSVVFVVISTVADRTVRESSDIESRFGIDVLASLPVAGRA